jgi:hypothetical protein
MLVRPSTRGNAAAAKSRCLSQVEKRYVTNSCGFRSVLVMHRPDSPPPL